MSKRPKVDNLKIEFFKWLAEEPRPWLTRYISDWKSRWSRWEHVRVRRSIMLWGMLADTTVSDDGCHFALQKTFHYWKRMRYIEMREDGERFMIYITKRGWYYLNRFVLSSSPRLPDGMVLLVLFDIPIGANETRDAFRSLLKRNGFWQLQQSVWYTDRDIRTPLRELLRGMDLDQWVVFGVLDFRETCQTIKPYTIRRHHQKEIFVKEVENDRALRQIKRHK